jgi:CheY-like chemotaxis protein
VDAVLIDVEAPGRSGLDVLATVRRKGWRIPVVLTSPYVSSMLQSEVIRTGAASILRKPLSLPELEQVLERVIVVGAAGRHMT